MRRQRGLVGLVGLATLVGLGYSAIPARAAVTTEQSASILIFPKVIADGTRDTIIQITNTSNNMRHAHCFYVNAALTNPSLPQGPTNPPLWQETDFDIWLTKQQPTHWVVSTGRLDPLSVDTCRTDTCDPDTTGTQSADCCDAGLEPGRVPPVVAGFQGELKCIEVDASGAPVGGNAFVGEATLEDPSTNDVSKYNAVGLVGFDTNNGDNILCLGGGVGTNCPNGAEYAACPNTWLIDHVSIDSDDPAITDSSCPDCSSSSLDANLTVAPCSEDFEDQFPQPVILQFKIFNEFEQALSASTTITCWGSFDLAEIPPAGTFTFGTLGSDVAYTRMRSLLSPAFQPLPSAPPPGPGVVAVLEETHTATFSVSSTSHVAITRSAQNVHTSFDDQANTDFIVIPGDQVAPPQQ